MPEVLAPLLGIAGCAGIRARTHGTPRGVQPGFQDVTRDGFPYLEAYRRVGLIITLGEIDESMGPYITSLRVIIHIGNLVTMMTIVR